VSDENVYHTAVVMSVEDAFEFGELLIAQANAAYGPLLDHYRQVIDSLPKHEEPNG